MSNYKTIDVVRFMHKRHNLTFSGCAEIEVIHNDVVASVTSLYIEGCEPRHDLYNVVDASIMWEIEQRIADNYSETHGE